MKKMILVYLAVASIIACNQAKMTAGKIDPAKKIELPPPGSLKSIRAQVRIENELNIPIEGALVSGLWVGPVNHNDSAVTDRNGYAIFVSPSSRSPGIYTFRVTSVSKNNSIYDSNSNVVTEMTLQRD